jgi:fluoroquinolone resistance protein
VADRRGGTQAPPTETDVRGADWYGDDLSGQEHTRVAFSGVDLSEATDVGAVFTECAFRDCRFNLSEHTDAAFLNCTFTGCSFFQATFVDCKFVGSMFDRCTFDLMTVRGGDWSFVGLPGADVRRATVTGARLREADLTGVRASGATLRGLDLSAAWFHDADLSGADLRGSDLSAVDPREVDLTGAQIDVAQAVALVTTLGLLVRPDAPQ